MNKTNAGFTPETLRLLGAALALQQANSTAANLIPIPNTGRFIAIGTPAEVARLLEIAPAAAVEDAAEPPSQRRERLRALADRIDHEKLWKRPMMFRDQLTDDQRNRLDAGVSLRRYADLLAPGRWLVLPPTGNVQFSAGSLEKVTEMAQRDQARTAGASAVEKRAETRMDAKYARSAKCAEAGAVQQQATPAIPPALAKLLLRLREDGVLSEGQITQALGVDRLTCREILEDGAAVAVPTGRRKPPLFCAACGTEKVIGQDHCACGSTMFSRTVPLAVKHDHSEGGHHD